MSAGVVLVLRLASQASFLMRERLHEPVWASFAVVWLKDSDEMPLITPS